MNANTFITHSISRNLAAKYGVNAAIVLAYIGYRIENSKNERDGRRWYYDTLDNIAKHYPYIGRSAIYAAIKRLTSKNGPLITGNYNKKAYDRTTWYAFKDTNAAQYLKSKPLYFKVIDAVAFGIVEAVLLSNLAYWINTNQRKNPYYRCHPMSPTELATILPFSRSTIQRALNKLVNEDVVLLTRRDAHDTRKPIEYSFAEYEDVKEHLASPNTKKVVFDVSCMNKEDNEILPVQTQNQILAGSNPNSTIPNTNMTSSNPNDYTILIDNCLKDPCLKEVCLKRMPPVFDSATFVNSLTSGNAALKDSGHNEFCESIVGLHKTDMPAINSTPTN
jgi:DNA-binding transcriptional regulator YhcF (GntR family)